MVGYYGKGRNSMGAIVKGRRHNGNPLVIAHRGYSTVFPENTLIAFEKAIEAGCDIIELDVQMTADERVVVFHDFTLERTTNGSGEVRNTTLERLKKLDAGLWRGEEFSGVRVPTLEEAIACVGQRVGLFIEIKAKRGEEFKERNERLCDKLSESLLKDDNRSNYILVSFDINCLERMRALVPEMERGLIAFGVNDVAKLAGRVEGLALFWKNVSRPLVKRAHEEGLWICPWTVDEPDRMREFVGMGVDAIASNDAVTLRRVIDEW